MNCSFWVLRFSSSQTFQTYQRLRFSFDQSGKSKGLFSRLPYMFACWTKRKQTSKDWFGNNCSNSQRLCRLMCGRPVAFRKVLPLCGLCPKWGHSPGIIDLSASQRLAAHQAAKPQRVGCFILFSFLRFHFIFDL